MIAHLVSSGSKQHKDKSGWDWDLSQVAQQNSFLQTHEGNQRVLQHIQLSNQDVGGLSTSRNFLQKVLIELQQRDKEDGELYSLTFKERD